MMQIYSKTGVILKQTDHPTSCIDGRSGLIFKSIHGYVLLEKVMQKSLLDDILNAIDGFDVRMITSSTNWKNWMAIIDIKTCRYCKRMHGKVYAVEDIEFEQPPAHENCRCEIKNMSAIFSGYATREGQEGADYWLMQYQTLPEHYITKDEAHSMGWIAIAGNLSDVAPEMMIGGDIYRNRNGHLPDAIGRIWYEADINYVEGYRTRHRILYSNDGLVFVTYDHYETFIEIV